MKWKTVAAGWLECLCRIGLGTLFIYSAWGKIADPGLFASMVMRYEMLPEFMVGIFSLTLPMVELLTGLALILTKWLREAAMLVTLLLAMFIVALSVAVIRGLDIDCGCFGVPSIGGRSELLLAIARDFALLAPSVWLLSRGNSWIGLRGLILLLVALLAFVGMAWLDVRPESSKNGKVPEMKAPPTEAKAQTIQKKTSRRKHAASVRRAAAADNDAEYANLSPENKKLLAAIEEAQDNEDIAATRELAAKALNSDSVEVRQAMVDSLGWFGAKALPELTPFLADADEDVCDSAMSEWSVAVSEIENDGEKVGVVELAMHVLTNEDALEDISGEYIGVDEKLAVNSLLRVIEAGGSEQGIAKAKDTYEFITGDTFTDRAAAEKWLAEEYEQNEKE